MSDDDIFEAYCLPDEATHPAIIADRLYSLPEHQHLRDNDATVDFLMRVEPKVKAGRQILGTAYMPTVQGELRDMFEWMLKRLLGRLPDFLIVLDKSYWNQATPHLREILVYHELSHCQQAVDQYGEPRFSRDGLPIWALRGHDVEEFTQVVRRYGAWNDEIRRFIEAAKE